MNATIKFVFFLLLLGISVSAQAVSRVVRQDGSGEFTTILSCLNGSQPGDTCVVGPGMYTEKLVFPRDGAAGQLITVRAEYPYNPNQSANRSVLMGTVTLRGFNAFVGMETRRLGISIDGSGSQVMGNFVRGEEGYPGGGIRIVEKGPRTGPFHKDITIKDNDIYLTRGGISILCAEGCLIENNDIERLYSVPECRPSGACPGDVDYVRMFGGGIIFRGNKIHGSSLAEIDEDAHVDGIQSFNNGGLGGQGRDTLSDTIIENNYVSDNHQAIWWTSVNGGMTSRNVTIRNNIFVNSWGSSARMAIGGPNVDELYIYNNTFHQSVRITAQTKTVVKNNIFWGNYMNTPDDRFAWPQLSYEMENNLFSLDAWLNKSIQSNGSVPTTNLFTSDIESNFVNSAGFDFRLVPGAQVIDAGTALHAQGFSADTYGNPRPQGAAWDIGAMEFCAGGVCVTPPPPTTTGPGSGTGGGSGNNNGTPVQENPQNGPDESLRLTFRGVSNAFHPLKESLRIEISELLAEATLVVYDKQGQEVRKLPLNGMYSIWDGRNTSGQLVASGTYVIVLSQGDKISKRRVVVIK